MITERPLSQSEIERIRDSEDHFFARILRVVEHNEVPGMEPWNVENAAAMLRRMWAAYIAAGGFSSVEEYQPRTPERIIEILKAQDQNPRSWQQEAAATLERLLVPT